MDATRAQRRMEVAARIKELRAEQAAQPGSPAAAGDVAPPEPEVVAPEVVAPAVVEEEAGETDQSGSAATTLADMLRSGGLFG